MLFCHLLIKINFVKKIFREHHQCQIVWLQIRLDILSGLIRVETVCKSYQQNTLAGEVWLVFSLFAKATFSENLR